MQDIDDCPSEVDSQKDVIQTIALKYLTFLSCLISSHPPPKPFHPAVMWDGHHWNFVRCLAQASMWEDMKHYMDTMGETYLREVMETIIEKASPRLYAQYWHGKEKTTDVHRSKKKKRKETKENEGQRGGAVFRRKPRLVDKIAEGTAMFLSGPSPSFIKLGGLVAKQAVKGLKDNVHHYRTKR